MNERAIREALGEEVLAGCPVMPAGYALSGALAAAGPAVGVMTGGAIGAAVGMAASREALAGRERPLTPGGHQKWMYMVIGPTQVGFFDLKQWVLWKSIGRLLLQLPRQDVTHCEFVPGKIGASRLTVHLADGATYALDVARVHRGKAEKVRALLAR